MNRTRWVFRAIFLLLTILLLIFLNRKTDDNTKTIVEFKLKMIDKIRTDSLDSKHKLELLINETTKFVDDSSHVREGIHYLVGLLTLWGAIELGFLIMEKRNYRPHEFK
jgi:regulatory protein YycI of two-component signal transduction system YycFG